MASEHMKMASHVCIRSNSVPQTIVGCGRAAAVLLVLDMYISASHFSVFLLMNVEYDDRKTREVE